MGSIQCGEKGGKSRVFKDVLVAGLALFAMFFGAGNLLFPPDIGVSSGKQWFLAYLFYFLADAGFGIIAVLAMVQVDGDIKKATGVVGAIPSLLINTAVILCIGPGVAIPRTAATTYEMGIAPMFGLNPVSKMGMAIFSVVFFVIVLAMTIRPSKVMDIIGKFLTPILVASLFVLMIAGIVAPKAAPGAVAVDSVVKYGITNGYQTMDLLGAMFFSIIVIGSLHEGGYNDHKSCFSISIRASAIAGVLLFLVYGGLAYLGASTGSLWSEGVKNGSVNQAALIINITDVLLGKAGVVILGLVVACACLTTAVGLVSAAGDYFSNLSNGRISYGAVAVIVCILSGLICNLGVSMIIAVAGPVLSILYPVSVLLIFTSFLRGRIKKLSAYRISAAVTFLMSVLTVIADIFHVSALSWVHTWMPLDGFGFNWLVPAVIAFVIGMFVPSKEIGDETEDAVCMTKVVE